MKAFAINGSARKDGNTALLLKTVCDQLSAHGIETDIFQLAGEPIQGCRACGGCAKVKNSRCVFDDDCLNNCIGKMVAADAIILGTPTYFAGASAQIKALIDRAGYVGRANGDLFRRKIGAAVVAVRRAGAIHAFDTLNHFFTIGQMIVVGSSYWNIGVGREIGEVENDPEGLATMRTLGDNMAWLLEKIAA